MSSLGFRGHLHTHMYTYGHIKEENKQEQKISRLVTEKHIEPNFLRERPLILPSSSRMHWADVPRAPPVCPGSAVHSEQGHLYEDGPAMRQGTRLWVVSYESRPGWRRGCFLCPVNYISLHPPGESVPEVWQGLCRGGRGRSSMALVALAGGWQRKEDGGREWP